MKYDLYPDYICTNGRLPSVDGHLGPEFENKGTASQSRDSTFFLCFNPVARRGNPRTWAVLNATENGWPLITTWSISKIMFFVSDFFSTQCSCFEGPKKNQRTWFSSTVLLHQVQAACHPIGGAHHPGMGVPLQATLVIVHRQHPHKLLKVDETWSRVVISLEVDFSSIIQSILEYDRCRRGRPAWSSARCPPPRSALQSWACTRGTLLWRSFHHRPCQKPWCEEGFSEKEEVIRRLHLNAILISSIVSVLPTCSPCLIDSLKRSSPACASSGWTRWGPSSRCGRHQLLP